MTECAELQLDAVLFGGGIAGLWTLAELTRTGHEAVLIEQSALGQGQTLQSQGIIHGGLKYTLAGLMNPSAKAIRDMPDRWRRSLDGSSPPDLSAAGLRAPCCHLWQTTSLRSRLGMVGARVGLRTAPVVLDADARPAALRACPGTVAEIAEPVIDPAAILESLAQPLTDRLMRIDPETSCTIDVLNKSVTVKLASVQEGTAELQLVARRVLLTAGQSNGSLREQMGLSGSTMQVRPLHMVLVRGSADVLPELNGHCVDGARTRVTITSAQPSPDQRVWQVGGELAERGVTMGSEALLRLARQELADVLPDLDFSEAQWATYRADRAEGRSSAGGRPDDLTVIDEDPIITAWPTKLALAPRLADTIVEMCGQPGGHPALGDALSDWARPSVAPPPWNTVDRWIDDATFTESGRA